MDLGKYDVDFILEELISGINADTGAKLKMYEYHDRIEKLQISFSRHDMSRILLGILMLLSRRGLIRLDDFADIVKGDVTLAGQLERIEIEKKERELQAIRMKDKIVQSVEKEHIQNMELLNRGE